MLLRSIRLQEMRHTSREVRAERAPLERATSILSVTGMLQRTALCLSLYKKGYKDRAKYWCSDDLIELLKDPGEQGATHINSLAQLHSIARNGDGEVDQKVLGEYQSLLMELQGMLGKVKEEAAVDVSDNLLKRIDDATSRLGRLYSECEL